MGSMECIINSIKLIKFGMHRFNPFNNFLRSILLFSNKKTSYLPVETQVFK